MGEYINRAKGKAKQVVGVLTGNKKLQQEGRRDELKGKVQGVAKKVRAAAK